MKIFKYIIPLICMVGATIGCECGKDKHKKKLIIQKIKDTDILSKEEEIKYDKLCNDWTTATPIQKKQIETQLNRIFEDMGEKFKDPNYMKKIMGTDMNINKNSSLEDKQEAYNKVISPFIEKMISLVKTLPETIVLDGVSKQDILMGMEFLKSIAKKELSI